MRTKIGRTLCLLFLLLPLTAANTLKLPRSGQVIVGQKAPIFSSWDRNDSVISLTKLLSQPDIRAVLVSFYASYCTECPKALQMLEKNKKRLNDLGIYVLLVNYREGADTISKFHKDLKLSLPVVTDEFAEISKAYGVRALPRAFLISKDQTVVAIYIYEGKNFVEQVIRDTKVTDTERR